MLSDASGVLTANPPCTASLAWSHLQLSLLANQRLESVVELSDQLMPGWLVDRLAYILAAQRVVSH